MSHPEEGEREPTQDELLAMAYVDGELDARARAEFERRLASERELGLEVAELQRLALLARQVTPREPKDFEWDRLRSEPLHSGGTLLGMIALAVGALGLFAWALYDLFTSDVHVVAKVCLALVLSGLTIVFLLILRARLRTLPHDPYTEVER